MLLLNTDQKIQSSSFPAERPDRSVSYEINEYFAHAYDFVCCCANG
jgi:hypothetical protein